MNNLLLTNCVKLSGFRQQVIYMVNKQHCFLKLYATIRFNKFLE